MNSIINGLEIGDKMKLIERIDGAEHYIKKFSEWEATEQIIDEGKAFWMLKKPDSEYQKVCLYRDGCNMFVYGDYGQFTFDSMTWRGSVYNLEYDNIGYQMEKLNYDSKQSLRIFDECACQEDILDWLIERLVSIYDMSEDSIQKVSDWIKKSCYEFDCVDIEEFCNENNLSDIEDILNFTSDCFGNAEEYEWISFLRNTSELDEFDESYESSLWNAGKRISQMYFVCMYALQVCGEKLEASKNSQ